MHHAVGLYYNVNRQDITEIASTVAAQLAAQDVCVYASDAALAAGAGVPCLNKTTFLQTISLMVVIGGDGTFLRAANEVRAAEIPLIGINRGNLGFLAELELEEFADKLPQLLSEQYTIESRMAIRAEVYRQGACLACTEGLNEVAINRNPLENTLGLDVSLFDERIDIYQADGVIIATPTGSTGYSMSAGGPLIYPGTDCLIVNPICPHILGTNPTIVPADSTIEVRLVHSAEEAYLLTDGRSAVNVCQNDVIRIYRAPTPTKIVQLEDHQFFETVRNKLLDRNYRRMHHKEGSHEK